MNYSKPCRAHAFRRQHCIPCQTYDPSRNLVALAYRDQYVNPPADDRLDPRDIVTEGVDEDGLVTRVRRLSWIEVLDMVERDARGEVRADD